METGADTDREGVPRLRDRQVAAVALGCAIEFYDVTVCSTFAVPIGRAFFPATTPWGSLLAAVAVFGAGFVVRPLGSLCFGAYADRRGRRPALVLTAALMALGTLGLAVTPSFAEIGVWASVLVVVARLVQGFALGGETGPSTVYLVEAARPGRRARAAAWHPAAHGAAVLAAGLVGAGLANLLPSAAFDAWKWRIAVAAGLAVVPAALAIRAALPDGERRSPETNVALLRRIGARWRPATLATIVFASGSVPFYIGTYMTSYALTTLHLTAATALLATIASGLGTLLFGVLGGVLADRFGLRPILVLSRLTLALAALPAFQILAGFPCPAVLMAVVAAVAALNALGAPASLCATVSIMPARARSTGLALVYALGTVFGGTAQFVVTLLIARTGDPLAPSYYLALASLAGALAGSFLPIGPHRRGAEDALPRDDRCLPSVTADA